jgi:hemoglobin
MKASHAHLNIGEKEWDAMVADFRKTLDAFKVPPPEQSELVAIVAGTKPDIVVAGK